MDNLQTPQSQETKDYLEKECGLIPYAPVRAPNYADPDCTSCKLFNSSNTPIRSYDKRTDFWSISCWSLVCSKAGNYKSTIHCINGPCASLLLHEY